jgi:hypothetical protein
MKRRAAVLKSTMLTLLMLGAAPLDSVAFDVTGTWIGKIRCNGRSKEKYSYTQEEIIFISQVSASHLNIRFQSEGSFGNHYTGGVEESNADPEGRGIIAFHRCFASEGDALRSRWVWAGTVRLSPDRGTGTMRLDHLSVTGAGAATATFEQCTGSFTLLSDRNPGVDTCS